MDQPRRRAGLLDPRWSAALLVLLYMGGMRPRFWTLLKGERAVAQKVAVSCGLTCRIRYRYVDFDGSSKTDSKKVFGRDWPAELMIRRLPGGFFGTETELEDDGGYGLALWGFFGLALIVGAFRWARTGSPWASRL